MTRIILREDCGNSPKNLLLAKLTTAFAQGSTNFILFSGAQGTSIKEITSDVIDLA